MIVYLAHPVGTDPIERAKNLANVQKWFLWLFHNTDWTINVPWFIYVSNLTEEHRERCLKDDLTILSTCKAIALTGGRLTGGMQTELGLAQTSGQKTFDLLSIGYEPPEPGSEAEKRAKEIVKAL